MKWEGREESENVEDRRGKGRAVGLAGLGGGGILVVILALIFGVNPQQLLGPGGMGGGGGGEEKQGPVDPKAEKQAKFCRVIFGDTERIWTEQFRNEGKVYEKPTLVLYTNQVESGCGSADSSVGPFYCPADAKVYIDTTFFDDMEKQLNAPGEFARAYVIAHEVGHHVQRLLGYSQAVDKLRRGGASKVDINNASVRLELQADFLAGVWAHHGQKQFNFIEPGDIESAMNAAYQIGDDRLQRKARGTVQPDSFTHGTSKQRQRWFMEGYKTGDVSKAKLLFSMPYDQL
jgi:predicted metalloprotease